MDDKRKYPRFNWSVIVLWKKCFDVPGGAALYAGPARDASMGGVRLILREGIKVGDTLELSIDMGGGKIFQGRGRVRWIEKFKITGGKEEIGYEGGVEFLDMDETTRQELARFLMQSRKET